MTPEEQLHELRLLFNDLELFGIQAYVRQEDNSIKRIDPLTLQFDPKTGTYSIREG
jgi:hypothetical protein